jgi:hypothetical protein
MADKLLTWLSHALPNNDIPNQYCICTNNNTLLFLSLFFSLIVALSDFEELGIFNAESRTIEQLVDLVTARVVRLILMSCSSGHSLCAENSSRFDP